jgi:plasmid stabilization system protein ParE
MRVRWLRKALSNLDDEATYIAVDDGAAARLVVKRVLDAVSMLAEQPGLGRPGRVPGTRELIVAKTRYIVPYRVRGEAVEILRVFHTLR